jgi:DNA adenine methylase
MANNRGSILRYPGGKGRAVKHLLPLFPTNRNEIFSPCAGGLSIELTLASCGKYVTVADSFILIVDLWAEAKDNPNRLADLVEAKYLGRLTRDGFYRLQKTAHTLPTRLERAAATFALNRTSHSGTILRGGYVGHGRFQRSHLDRLRGFRCPNLVDVYCADFSESIPAHGNYFLYVDPPYMLKGKLTGDNNLYGFPGQNSFDHVALAHLLKARNGWILSYRDCQEVRSLYSEYRFIPLEWAQGMSPNRSGHEIVILSPDVSIPKGTTYFMPKRLGKSGPRVTGTVRDDTDPLWNLTGNTPGLQFPEN